MADIAMADIAIAGLLTAETLILCDDDVPALTETEPTEAITELPRNTERIDLWIPSMVVTPEPGSPDESILYILMQRANPDVLCPIWVHPDGKTYSGGSPPAFLYAMTFATAISPAAALAGIVSVFVAAVVLKLST